MLLFVTVKVEVTNVSRTKRLLSFIGDETDLAKIKKHTLELLRPKVSASGFRTGHAPLGVVETQLGADRVQSEVLEEAVNHFYSETLIERKLRAIDQPKIEIKKYMPFTSLEFTAEIETVPPVKLGDYKKIKVKSDVPNITDNDIDKVIENLRLKGSDKKPVNRAAKMGDELIIDFSGKDTKGKEVAGAKGENYPLILGSKTFIPGFEEELIGLAEGNKKTFTVTFPKDYAVKSLASSKVKFQVTVKSVNQVDLPIVDDEFAKKLGPFSDVSALRNDIRTQLLSQRMREADSKAKDEILLKLASTSQVILPEVLIQDQIRHLEEDFVNNLTYRGMTLKEYLKQENLEEDEWRSKSLMPQAEQRVKIGLILSEVAREENLSVTEDEISLRVNLMKNQYQDEAAKAELDNPNTRRDIANRLLTEKTLEALMRNSIGTDS